MDWNKNSSAANVKVKTNFEVDQTAIQLNRKHCALESAIIFCALFSEPCYYNGCLKSLVRYLKKFVLWRYGCATE